MNGVAQNPCADLEEAYEDAVEVVRAWVALDKDLSGRIGRAGMINDLKKFTNSDRFGLFWRHPARIEGRLLELMMAAAGPEELTDPLFRCLVSEHPRQAMAIHLINRFGWDQNDVEALRSIHAMNTRILPELAPAKQWVRLSGVVGFFTGTLAALLSGWSPALALPLRWACLAALASTVLYAAFYRRMCSTNDALLALVGETLEYADALSKHSAGRG